MTPDPSAWSLLTPALTTLAGGAVAAGTLLVKSWLDRKARGDAFAVKLHEARIAAYPSLQSALFEAYLACAVDAQKRADGEEVAEHVQATWDARVAAMRIEHLFSKTTHEAINKGLAQCDVLRATIGNSEAVDGAMSQAAQALSDAKNAMRRDCHTDPIDAHSATILPRPAEKPRELLSHKRQAPKPAALPSKTGADS